MRIPTPLIFVLFALLLAAPVFSTPTAAFVPPTPASGTANNSTVSLAWNFTYANITACIADVGGVNHSATLGSGNRACLYNATLPANTNTTVRGWVQVANASFVYEQDSADSYVFWTDGTHSVWTDTNLFHDLNWNTSATYTYSDPFTQYPGVNITFNTIPANVTPGSLFYFKMGTVAKCVNGYCFYNFSHAGPYDPEDCLKQTTLLVQIYGQNSVRCWNGTGLTFMTPVGTTNAPVSPLYESAMNWSIATGTTVNPYPTNETRSYCYGNCTTPPSITLISPANDYFTNNENVTFAFSATDDSNLSMSCSIYIDGVNTATNSSVQESTATYFNISIASTGTHYWGINCSDTLNNSAMSATRNFTLDKVAPAIALVYPPNAAVFNASTFNFTFTPTDDLSPTLTCWIYINGVLAGSGTTYNDSLTSLPSPYLSGTNTWQVYCADLAGNTNASAVYSFAVTQIIVPELPVNDSLVSGTNINLRYSFYSAVPTNMTCAVYVDNTLISNSTSEFPVGITTQNLWIPADGGTHTWNVICIDANTNGTIIMPPQNFSVGTGVWGDVTFSLTPNTNFVNVSTNVTFLIASNLSKLDFYGMNITFYNFSTGNTTLVYSQLVNSSPGGGTLQYLMGYNGTYRILVYFSENGQLFVMPWVIQFGTNQGIQNVANQLQGNPPISGFAWYFIALCVAVIVAGFVSRFTVLGAGWAAIGVLWVFSLLYAGVTVVQLGTVALDGIAITTFATVMVAAGSYLGWYG